MAYDKEAQALSRRKSYAFEGRAVGEGIAESKTRAERFAESAAKLKAGWAKRCSAAQSAAEARRIVEVRGGFGAVETGTDYERFVDGLITAAGVKVRRVG